MMMMMLLQEWNRALFFIYFLPLHHLPNLPTCPSPPSLPSRVPHQRRTIQVGLNSVPLYSSSVPPFLRPSALPPPPPPFPFAPSRISEVGVMTKKNQADDGDLDADSLSLSLCGKKKGKEREKKNHPQRIFAFPKKPTNSTSRRQPVANWGGKKKEKGKARRRHVSFASL